MCSQEYFEYGSITLYGAIYMMHVDQSSFENDLPLCTDIFYIRTIFIKERFFSNIFHSLSINTDSFKHVPYHKVYLSI